MLTMSENNKINSAKMDEKEITDKGKKEFESTSMTANLSNSYPIDLSITDIDPSLTFTTTSNTSDAPIQIKTPSDSYTTLYDEFQNTIQERGFEETIRMSNDFKPGDIKIEIGGKNFTVSGTTQLEPEPKSTTITSHKFYHSREFNRPIKNVEMEVGKGVAKVYGEFADF